MKKTSFLLIIIVCACMNQAYLPEEDYGSLNTLKTIDLLDTFTNDLKFDFEDKISKASYHPIYIGPKEDSIQLTYSSRKINNRVSKGSYRMPQQEDIELHVDVSKTIGTGNDDILGLDLDQGIHRELMESRGNIRSHPVIIVNKSRDTLNIGLGEHIPMILVVLLTSSKLGDTY